MNVRETLKHYDFFDQAIVQHGPASYSRDYHVVVDIYGQGAAGMPVEHMATYDFLFRGCVEVCSEWVISPAGFSLDDVFIDFDAYNKAGGPDGFVWGVGHAEAYPGLTYVEDSEKAMRWSQRYGVEMHEVLIETNAYKLDLVFADLEVTETAILINPDAKPMPPETAG